MNAANIHRLQSLLWSIKSLVLNSIEPGPPDIDSFCQEAERLARGEGMPPPVTIESPNNQTTIYRVNHPLTKDALNVATYVFECKPDTDGGGTWYWRKALAKPEAIRAAFKAWKKWCADAQVALPRGNEAAVISWARGKPAGGKESQRINPVQIAAILRQQADRLEVYLPGLGKLGISPSPIVRQSARIACGAWAWIARNKKEKFYGHTHCVDFVPFPFKDFQIARAKNPNAPAGEKKCVAVSPWNRLNAFTAWASSLPGTAGMPHGPRQVERWPWAMRTVALWVEQTTEAIRPAPPAGAEGKGKNKLELNGTAKAAAKYIRANPGCKGDAIAVAISVTAEHFRSRVFPKLIQRGFYNQNGYRPPAKKARGM